MFTKRIRLFTLLGFEVRVDLTWLILAVLITWTFAQGLFPHLFEGYSTATYWGMGLAGAAGLFGSIVFHEFWHSMIARRYGIAMKGITLFIFGGVAEMQSEPENPKSELLMAIAGPASSVGLAGIAFGVSFLGVSFGLPGPVNDVLKFLAGLNLILAGFNLLPAFPLDGGRVLRSILWSIKGNLRWATKVASHLGSGFGIFLIVLGVLSFIGGNFIGGVWYALLGLFIRGASQMSYRQVLIRRALAGEQVRRFMKTDPVTVSPSLSIQQLVEDYIYRYHYKMFPVLEDGRLRGCVTTAQVKELPRDEWANKTVGELASSCSDDNTVTPDTDAMKALSTMNSTGNSRLMVLEGDRLVGIITLKDMLGFLGLKIDLEGE